MRPRVPFGAGLRARLGAPSRPRRLESSPRSWVWRVELAGAPAVVKQFVEGPGAAERYGREVAALRLAARAEPAVAPALLGTDPDKRVLVLAYVEHRPPPRDWIVGWAKALARLHATAFPADAGLLPAWSGPTRDDADSFVHLAERLGVTVAPGVPAELAALVGRLDRAGGHALLHGDPCPGNDLHTDDGVKFIDFEQASLGNGLVELAYLRIGFPTCWCVTKADPSVLDRAETAYRTTWTTLTGTDPGGDLADACAGWLLRGDALVERAHRETVDHLARIPDRDWTWGTATARQRLAHRLGVVAGMTADRPDLHGLHAVSSDLRRNMLARWPSLEPVPAGRP
ncbi:aminoglycoside phosphotransferase family protein [Streptomyces sp. NPDC087420]|uniref:aminoglycoside phosphotransferase family protein n=1 Tax=Streptomyces sp. NPDC087420 TaxID=3365785 RepID=UPI003837C81D